jgi:hypothetical protein
MATAVARPGRARWRLLGDEVDAVSTTARRATRAGMVVWTGAHRSSGSMVRGRRQLWSVAFQGGGEAPVADGGGGRHLQYRRGEGMVRGKAIWPKKAWRRRSSRIMVGGGVDSESGYGCDALVGRSGREAGG